jgi:hypothetical protein
MMAEQNPAPVKMETYQHVMAENILNQIGIRFSNDELIESIQDSNSKYFLLLKLPMKICMNTLIINQIDSYKLFCQKRLIDYVVLTNPNEEEQNTPGFQDKIPQDVLTQKERLEAFQHQIRETYQDYYDVVAKIWNYLRQLVQSNKVRTKGFDLSASEMEKFASNIQDYEDKIEKFKLVLLNYRIEAQEIARVIVQMINEKNEFNLELSDDEAEKLDLRFYQNLGVEAQA